MSLRINLSGILVIGGDLYPGSADRSVEFWAVNDSDQQSCQLDNYSREMKRGSTSNLVSDKIVACYASTCEVYQEGVWNHLQDMAVYRLFHSAIAFSDKVLLIGGQQTDSTEFISVDGSDASPGPFKVRHRERHCSMKISEDVIVVTGGLGTDDLVTEYHLSDGRETALTTMTQGRGDHACGVYQDTDGQQVSGEVQTSLFADFE